MAKILNFGSLNVDHVYSVSHFVRAGETLASTDYQLFCGGKGLNQSIALAKCGATVYHAGSIGDDGAVLINELKQNGVCTELIQNSGGRTGHAIIQVDEKGQNCILLYGGSNKTISTAYADEALESFGPDDYLLLQNEINQIPYIMKTAKAKGMRIVFNPSPLGPEIYNYPLELVDIFIMNEIEGSEITHESEPDKILAAMRQRFPHAAFVLTLGDKGSLFDDGKEHFIQPIFKVKVLDTTAAGDTFTGYFIGSLIQGRAIPHALETAALASSLSVSRMGAASSIPLQAEVEAARK